VYIVIIQENTEDYMARLSGS